MMKLIFVLTVFLSGLPAMASTYTLLPDNATKLECEKMGMTGEFELRRYEDPRSVRGRQMVFLKSGEDLPVTQSRSDKNLYTTLVKCQYGCSGSMEIRLDLGSGEFLYKRNIRFDDGGGVNELCRGVVR